MAKKQTIKRNNKSAKASTGKGLKKSFDLKSRKVQFFVAIAIVALLGGGWFTYKSFAYSDVIQSTVAKYNPRLATDTEKKAGSNKKGAHVARIKPGQEAKWTVPQYIGNKDMLPNFNASGKYRFCIFTRYENPSPNSQPASIKLKVFQKKGINMTGAKDVKAETNHTVKDPTKYGKKCTVPSFVGWGRDDIELQIINKGPSTIRVGAFTIERL